MSTVRTRFAVSPTGFMHVGGARNALFDWLLAHQHGGQFILRIEDTDQAREVPGAVDHIIETLHWLGLQWDEGPDIGGPAGIYVQSQRLEIYREWGQKLLDAGKAYTDPYSQEQLENFRQQAVAQKKPFLYRNHRPEQPPEWDGSQPLRLKSDPKPHKWHDEVMGDLSAGAEAVDDFVLIKSDGFPTYNFCHIIDDHLMQISHVIRSQEFLASVPKYLNLYEALGIEVPVFATLPWIMAPDGKKKLSKRDGAKDILDYRNEGYLPATLLNFLASLGWNDGTEQEIFSVTELVKSFRLDHVQRSGARFDERRLLWMNGAHIRELKLDELYEQATDFWPEEAKDASEAYKRQVLGIVQERLKYFAELPSLTKFFFAEPAPDAVEHLYREPVDKQLKNVNLADIADMLGEVSQVLADSDFSGEDIAKRLNDLLEKLSTKPGVLFSIVRIAVTGAQASPAIFDTLSVLGKETSLNRLERARAGLRDR